MTVTFTAKELFQQINESLKEITAHLEGKADSVDVARIEARLDIVEDSIKATDLVAAALKADKGGRFTRNQKIIGLVYASINIAVGILALGPDVIH